MVKKTENAVTKADKPWQFSKGQSGNPAGKPKGTLHKSTQAMQTLLEGEMEALTRKVVELALAGDTTALRLCLDRIAPAIKPSAQRINLEMPAPDNLTDTAKALVMAAASGEIPPDIAAQLVSAVASVARVEEMEHVKERLEALEKAIKDQIG
jgi:Family of unknown function (DUF5681)